MTIRDWDRAYDNIAHVPGAPAIADGWAAQAGAYRRGIGAALEANIAYGTGARQRLDIVWPEAAPKGLAVFVHGGYWRRFCKDDWTHLAEGARASGWAVAIPSYTLAPQARIAAITQEIGAAIAQAAGRVDGPVRLAGHSAGGHLVARMICEGAPLPGAVAERIGHVVSISGLHDLRPLLRTAMNDTLKLDLDEARAQSPALLEPRSGAAVTAWVGGGELGEFVRQAEMLAVAWSGFDLDTDVVLDCLHNHFTVIEALKDADSRLVRRWLGP